MPTRRIFFFSFALASQHVLLDVNLHLTLQINVVATECILVYVYVCQFLVGTIIPSWLASIFLLISYSSLFVPPHKRAIILNSPPPPCPVDTIYYGGCVAQCYPINASTTTSLETNTPHYYFLFSSISYSTVLKLLCQQSG